MFLFNHNAVHLQLTGILQYHTCGNSLCLSLCCARSRARTPWFQRNTTLVAGTKQQQPTARTIALPPSARKRQLLTLTRAVRGKMAGVEAMEVDTNEADKLPEPSKSARTATEGSKKGNYEMPWYVCYVRCLFFS